MAHFGKAATSAEFESLVGRVAGCQACESVAYSHVLGETNGSLTSAVMFVGEAPGRRGAGRTGIPFSGDESGRRFEAFLALAGLSRENVFITNALLCNPLDSATRNRRPSVAEVRQCLPFLRAQVVAVDPSIVVALGGVALFALGQIESHDVTLKGSSGHVFPWFNRHLMPLYHVGRRSTVHRPEEEQKEDWRRLARLVTTEDLSSI